MNLKYMKLFTVVLLAGLIIAGCKKKKTNDNEEENITTVKVTLTPVAGGAAKIFIWKDVDGDGGNDPSIEEILFNAST